MSMFWCSECADLCNSDEGAEEIKGKLVCAECIADTTDDSSPTDGPADTAKVRREALEEAAKVADGYMRDLNNPIFARACAENIAAAIRALSLQVE